MPILTMLVASWACLLVSSLFTWPFGILLRFIEKKPEADERGSITVNPRAAFLAEWEGTVITQRHVNTDPVMAHVIDQQRKFMRELKPGKLRHLITAEVFSNAYYWLVTSGITVLAPSATTALTGDSGWLMRSSFLSLRVIQFLAAAILLLRPTPIVVFSRVDDAFGNALGPLFLAFIPVILVGFLMDSSLKGQQVFRWMLLKNLRTCRGHQARVDIQPLAEIQVDGEDSLEEELAPSGIETPREDGGSMDETPQGSEPTPGPRSSPREIASQSEAEAKEAEEAEERTPGDAALQGSDREGRETDHGGNVEDHDVQGRDEGDENHNDDSSDSDNDDSDDYEPGKRSKWRLLLGVAGNPMSDD